MHFDFHAYCLFVSLLVQCSEVQYSYRETYINSSVEQSRDKLKIRDIVEEG